MIKQKHTIHLRNIFRITILGCMLFLCTSNSLFSQNQKLKTKSDSVKFDKQTIEFEELFIRANLLKNKKDYSQAIAMYFDCLRIFPKSASTLFEIAQIYSLQNKYKDAEKTIQKAIKIAPEKKDFYIFLAQVYEEMGLYEKQVVQIQKLISLEPSNIDYYYAIYETYYNYSQFAKSLQIIEQIESKFGNSEDVLTAKYRIYYSLEDYDKTEFQLQQLVTLYPDESDYWFAFAKFYSSQEKFSDALRIYNQMLVNESNTSIIHVEKAKLFSEMNNNDSLIQEINNIFAIDYIDADKKLDLFNDLVMKSNSNSFLFSNRISYALKLLQVYPHNVQLNTLLSQFYIDSSQYHKALPYLYEIIGSDNSKYQFFKQIVDYELQLSNWDSVISVGNKALEVFPNNSELYIAVSQAYIQKKLYHESINILNQGIDIVFLKKHKKMFYANLAESYFYIDSVQLSNYYFNESLAIDSANTSVLAIYAYFLALQNTSIDKAQSMLNVCLQNDSTQCFYHIIQAVINSNSHKYSDALFEIEKCTEYSRTPQFYEHYGDILYLNSFEDKAIIQWQNAIDKGAIIDIQRKKVFLQKK